MSNITHHVVAVDKSGAVLFTVDRAYSYEQAQDGLQEARQHKRDNPHAVDDEVDGYRIDNA